MSFTRGQMAEIQAGIRPLAALRTVTLDGGIRSGALSAKAAASTVLTGTQNDMTFTADTAGLAGNSITVEYADPGVTIARAIDVSCSGTAIKVTLATANLTAASKVLTTDNTELTDGDTVTIDSIVYRFKDTPALAYDVKRHGTTADTTMGNLIKAINATGTPGTEYFAGTLIHPTVSAGALAAHAFTVTAKTSGTGGNAIVIAEASSHLSWASGATLLSGGLNGGQIISLASEVKTAIEANTAAAALVDITNFAGNDGMGVVTAMSPLTLASGSDGTIPLFTVRGECLVSLRGYIQVAGAGASSTLVHGKTGTTNDLITILTVTNFTKGAGIDSTAAVVARGTALAKTPLKLYHDTETIFATVATAAATGGVIHYLADFVPLTEDAGVVIT